MQLDLPFKDNPENDRSQSELAWLRQQGFDIRRRFYETDENYLRRIEVSFYAFGVDYNSAIWRSLDNWVIICPRGSQDRLPSDKSKLLVHDCFYLQIKHIQPENWLPPHQLSTESAQQLPRRATYIPIHEDILLSRFKEPLGKCVIYLSKHRPLYASSNYLLLRAKPNVSPLVVLSLLKSSFLACQLHHLIQQRTVITELFQYEAVKITLPNLPMNQQEQIKKAAQNRLTVEEQFSAIPQTDRKNWYSTEEGRYAREVMNRVDIEIDSIIQSFCKNFSQRNTE